MANSAAIAGASGLVGSHLLPLLLESYDPVAALTRRPLGVSSPKLREMPLGEAFPFGVAAGFCCLGTTIRKAGSQEAFRKVDFDAIVDFARRCREAGATHFALVSSVGADRESPTFYLRVKGEAEEAIRDLGFTGLYLLRPSFLMGNRGSEHRAGEKLGIGLAKVAAPLLAGPLSKYRAVEASTVAQAMVAAVREGRTGTHVLEYKEIVRLCDGQ